MDEIDGGFAARRLQRVKYMLNTHENFDDNSANHYFEKNSTVIIGSDGCWEALPIDRRVAEFAEMAVSEGGEAYRAAFAKFRAYLNDFHQRLAEFKYWA